MTDSFAERTAGLAVRSLLREAEAAPKPGLVDRFGPGAHADMDIGRFRLSAAALGPYFRRMVIEAASFSGVGADAAGRAEALRSLGIEAEAAMLEATGGVNTHKGAIWTLGLLCAAAGSLAAPDAGSAGEGAAPWAEEFCDEAARLARDIVGLAPPAGDVTHGQAARLEHGLRSARDEAMQGFPAIRAGALPAARRLRGSGLAEDRLVVTVLLEAMAEADDTCLVARGGLEALNDARALARRVLDAGGPASPAGAPVYARMVAGFNAARLSPGGSADLCAASLFLADLEAACVRRVDADTACLARAWPSSPLEPFVVRVFSPGSRTRITGANRIAPDPWLRRSAGSRSFSSICQTILPPTQQPGPQLSRGTIRVGPKLFQA